MDRSGGHELCLQVVPFVTGYLSTKKQLTLRHVPLYNHEIPVYAAEVTAFSFAVYGFNSGHFVAHRGSYPFQTALAADTQPCGRALFKQFTGCPIIADWADGLLQSVASSKAASTLHGYCIHSHRFLRRETEKKFWSVQAAIIRALRNKRGLITI